MKTDTTWPVAVQHVRDWVLLGIPQRLGDGAAPVLGDTERFRSLEEVAGADWSGRTLALLLPGDRVWAWWLPSRSPALAAMGCEPMPRRVALRSLKTAVCRRWFLRGMALALVPPGRKALQDRVVEYAGYDTEQAPEFIWVAGEQLDDWEPERMARWCRDRTAWQDPGSLAATGAERVVVLFDGQLYCGLRAAQADAVLRALQGLAQGWGLSVIDGPQDLAWPTPAAGGGPPQVPQKVR